MARRPFAGGGDALVLHHITGKPIAFAAGTAWTARSGGTRITDLADAGGVPLADGLLLTDGGGAIPPFMGPTAGTEQLWVDFGSGRYLLTTTDLPGRVDAVESAAVGTFGTTAGTYAQGNDSRIVGAVQRGTVTTKGDLLVATGAGSLTRLPVGSGGQVLTVDPGSATGLSFQSPLLGGVVAIDLTMTSAVLLLSPAVTPQNGFILKVKALASGADRNLIFDDPYRLSTAFASKTFTVPSGQTFVGEAEYSTLAAAWVITQATFTTGSSGGGGGGGSLNAGSDASIAAAATFSRTATEPSSPAITSRAWTIQSGPIGAGTTIGAAAALSWVPGSTPSGSTDIRHPVYTEMAFELTSTAENSTKDWTTSYSYIQDILDGRGYTGGLVGFTSATGDMLALVQYYQTLRPTSNPLASYIPGLQACSDFGDTVDDAVYGVDGGGASDIAAAQLGSAFLTAWASAANTDALFRQAQRDLRASMYLQPALNAAIADGVGGLGFALYYDTSVNHGPGEANSNDGSFDDIRSRTTGTKPISGGNQRTFLRNFCTIRSAVLTEWGDNPADGRMSIWNALLNPTSPNFDLAGTVTWSVYGDSYSMNRPPPPSDATKGVYVLRYTATPAGFDTVTVTVT
jgi:chitosanase